MNRYAIAALLLVSPLGLSSCTNTTSYAMDSFVMDPYVSSRAMVNSETYISRKLAPMDENRRVSEQDCSQQVDLEKGNLRCK